LLFSKKSAQSKQSPYRRKFTHSGHPAYKERFFGPNSCDGLTNIFVSDVVMKNKNNLFLTLKTAQDGNGKSSARRPVA
jgi:hypothetical protein